ncbi:hypothetical protein H6F42_16315 [Pseudanabaena sp. FACHB-1998]|uniref:hypothetical protein n=1 Tax=Pseudanabaena sp. FACHB-1998 TaxID=2692858 RepID=UPI0016815514|nr:hypothetical protein [Pseudanabaena sp. FACHB-1998]MBD2178484.1 hypothetical protein [Pseudanabaena sp. FACHB-1998]
MSQALKTSLFQEALTAIEALSLDDQTALIDVLNNRLKLRQRQQVIGEVREVQKEYREGKFKSGSVDDFLAELDK